MKYVGVATLALLLGFAIGWVANLAPSDSESRVGRSETPARPAEVGPPIAIEPATDVAPAAHPVAPSVARSPGGLISDELARYARDEIAAGWTEIRKDPIPDATRERGFGEFEEIVKRTPREIGRRLAEGQNDGDSLAGNDLVAILRALDRSELGPQLALVRDAERFPALFQCAGGSNLDGPTVIADSKLLPSDSATLLFGPGVHRLSRFLENANEAPRCLTLAGAGMNQTMLVLGDVSVRGVLDRFAIRDCTVFTHDAYLFDLRREPAVVELDRVRLCGFDTGAGSSCAFGTRATAIFARDCRFEGGYGRYPGSGNLFRIDTRAFLARFERCTISAVSIPVRGIQSEASVLFSHCTIDRLLDQQRYLDDAPRGLVFEACSIQLADPSAPYTPPRELDDLFPDWRELARR